MRSSYSIEESYVGTTFTFFFCIAIFYLINIIRKKQDSLPIYTISGTYPTDHSKLPKSSKCLSFASIPKVPTDEMVRLSKIFRNPQYLHQYAAVHHHTRGPIYRDTLGSPQDILFVADPDTIHAIHKASGAHPEHTVPDQWREYLADGGRKRGLFFMEGEEWKEYRTILSKKLLRPKILKSYFHSFGRISQEFLESALQHQKEGILEENLVKCLYRWSLEEIFVVALEKEIAHFGDEEKFSKFSDCVHANFRLTLRLQALSPDIKQQKESPFWKEFCDNCDYTLDTASDFILTVVKESRVNGPSSDSLVDELVHGDKLPDEVIVRLIADLVLAAADTSVATALWLLYVLGTESAVSKKGKDVVKKWKEKSGNKDIMSLETSDLSEFSYLRDILKETLRLYPVATFLTRKLEESTELLGYKIPGETMVIISLYSIGRDEKYFTDCTQFNPRRWNAKEATSYSADEETPKSDNCPMQEATNKSKLTKLATLPWGIGDRKCIGRNLSETQLTVLMIHLLDSVDIKIFNAEDIHMKMEMISVPSEPLQIQLIDCR